MVNALGRAVLRAILYGADELQCITPPPMPGRDYLDDPIMLAQRRDRKPHNGPRHGPVRNGKIQPIRKWVDVLRNRWTTNEQ